MSASAIEAVRRCQGPLFNGFADGGVIAWFVPERRIFVDSRGVEAYPIQLLLRSREADLSGHYRQLFEDFEIGCAAVAAGSPIARQLAADGYFGSSMRMISGLFSRGRHGDTLRGKLLPVADRSEHDALLVGKQFPGATTG